MPILFQTLPAFSQALSDSDWCDSDEDELRGFEDGSANSAETAGKAADGAADSGSGRPAPGAEPLNDGDAGSCSSDGWSDEEEESGPLSQEEQQQAVKDYKRAQAAITPLIKKIFFPDGSSPGGVDAPAKRARLSKTAGTAITAAPHRGRQCSNDKCSQPLLGLKVTFSHTGGKCLLGRCKLCTRQVLKLEKGTLIRWEADRRAHLGIVRALTQQRQVHIQLVALQLREVQQIMTSDSQPHTFVLLRAHRDVPYQEFADLWVAGKAAVVPQDAQRRLVYEDKIHAVVCVGSSCQGFSCCGCGCLDPWGKPHVACLRRPAISPAGPLPQHAAADECGTLPSWTRRGETYMPGDWVWVRPPCARVDKANPPVDRELQLGRLDRLYVEQPSTATGSEEQFQVRVSP